MFNLESTINLFRDYQEFAIPISIILNIIIALSGVIPSIFLTGANIIFFGPIVGFSISILGETIGAYITFKLYRVGFKKSIEGLSNKHKLLKRIVNSEGKKAGFLIFEGRLIPFIPSGFVTLAASISNVGGGIFMLATFFGKIPSIALEALISYDFINIEENFIRLGITIVGLILLFVTLKFRKKENY